LISLVNYILLIYRIIMQSKIGGAKPRNNKPKSASKRKDNNSAKAKSKKSSKIKQKTSNKNTRKRKRRSQPKIKEIDSMWNTIFNRVVDENPDVENEIKPVLPVEQTTEGIKPVVIVLIHAEWCGHCKTLQPEWDIMENSLSDNEKQNITFEVIESAELDNKLPIVSQKYMNGKPLTHAGFPTIGNIQDGEFQQYGGGRTSNDLLDWIRGLLTSVRNVTA